MWFNIIVIAYILMIILVSRLFKIALYGDRKLKHEDGD